MKTETRWHNTGRVCLTEVCRDWFTLVLMVVISEGLGGAKNKIKRGRRRNVGVWNSKRQNDIDKTIQRFVDWVNRCLVCSLVLLWWAFLCIPLTLHVEIQHHEISTVHWPQWYSCHCKILHFRATLTKCSIQLLLYNWHVYGGKNWPQYFEFHTQLNT